MSYQALARKWRPRAFSEVIGQEHVVAALSNGLSSERIHHAYLFSGTRGVGKTTLARIFAKALNCEQGIRAIPCGECAACKGVDQGNFIDLLEVDAASRTKVDDTRELLDNVQYTPSQGRFKIYLIDEVHMLSGHSFNALLKTLEEPPAHVKFLLATTDPQKLPPTILSRCIQFNLKSMEVAPLADQLVKILTAEQVEYDREAVELLARCAAGSVRDALSLLDQGIAYGDGEVRAAAMHAMLGMIERRFVIDLLERVCRGDAAAALEAVAAMALRSVDFAQVLGELLTTLHHVSLYGAAIEVVEAKGIDAAPLAALAQDADPELVQLLYQIALIGKRDLPLAADPRSGFEMVVLRMIAFRPQSAAGAAPPAGAGAQRRPREAAAGQGAGGANDKKAPAGGAGAATAGRADAKGAARRAAAAGAATAPADQGEAPPRPAADPTAAPPPEAAAAENAAAVTIETLGTPDGWAAYAARCPLGGLARQMMMNMAPQSARDGTLEMVLAAAHAPLLKPARVEKIRSHLEELLGCPITLKVTPAGEEQVDTPSRRHAAARQEEHAAAEQAFNHDPQVREMMTAFDAQVVPDSVRPAPDKP